MPALLVLGVLFAVPESVRWLLLHGRREAVRAIVMRAAAMNGVQLSEGAMAFLHEEQQQQLPAAAAAAAETTVLAPTTDTFVVLLRSRILATRLAVNMAVWLLAQFLYFGLTVQSVSLAGNKHVNFIVACAAELPDILVGTWLMQRFGRKWSLFGSLAVCAAACVATAHSTAAPLFVYLAAKCSASIAYAVLYVYSAEQFATATRHSTIIACYCCGTMGSMAAPFTMLLVSGSG